MVTSCDETEERKMKGSMVIGINQANMQKIIQYYFEAVMFNAGFVPKVTSVELAQNQACSGINDTAHFTVKCVMEEEKEKLCKGGK